MHLFAGAGGGLLADLILGHTPIVAVEWDAYCCAVLRERAADGWFPGLHVYEGDIRLFDPSEYAGRVDCIHAGFPCQDISHAGRQAGVGEGTRSGLYREVLRIADVVLPRYLFLENVAAILGNGLDVVLGDLAERGYDSRWTCLRASDCGAPHRRDRWWCVAVRNADEHGEPDVPVDAEVGNVQELLADTSGERLDIRNGESGVHCEAQRKNRREATQLGCEARGQEVVSDAFGWGSPGQREHVHACNQETYSEGQADEPVDGGVGSFWGVEPDVGRVAHGVASRVDRLKALGNGQVPLQAALAWRILTETMP